MSPIFCRIVIKLTGPAAKRLATGLAVGAASVGVGTEGAIFKNSEAFFECVKETIKTIDPQIDAKNTTPVSLVIDVEAETKEAYDKFLTSYVNGELLAIINKAVQEYAEKYDDPQPLYDEIEIIYPKAAEPVETYVSQSPTEVLSDSIKDEGILRFPERNIPFDSEYPIPTDKLQLSAKKDHQQLPGNDNQTNIGADIVNIGDMNISRQHAGRLRVVNQSVGHMTVNNYIIPQEHAPHKIDIKKRQKFPGYETYVSSGRQVGPNPHLRCEKHISIDHLEKNPEIDFLSRVKHNNVVHYYDVKLSDNKEKYILCTELCCTTVQTYITKKGSWVDTADPSEPIIREAEKNDLPFSISLMEILQQATEALKYLHTRKSPIIHRDVKPSNFLLTKDAPDWRVKVGDFGISRKISKDKTHYTTEGSAGTKGYFSPEQRIYDKQGKYYITLATDIFSFGAMWYFVLTGGKNPFITMKEVGEEKYTDVITEDPNLVLEEFDDSLTLEQQITARQLIGQMLEKKAEDRPTIHEVAAHPALWDARKKVFFISDSHKHIEDQLIKVTESLEGVEINFRRCKDDDLHERLNHFDKRLLLDCDQGNNQEKQKFDISLEILPQSVREVTGMHKVKSCRNVEEFLKVMRNKASHPLTAAEQAELFGDKKGDEKWEIFLHCFLEGREHLLVHLYQVFKDVEELSGYY